jgi:hypothetical protein
MPMQVQEMVVWYQISGDKLKIEVVLIAAGLTTVEERGVHTTRTCCSKHLDYIRMAVVHNLAAQ